MKQKDTAAVKSRLSRLFTLNGYLNVELIITFMSLIGNQVLNYTVTQLSVTFICCFYVF